LLCTLTKAGGEFLLVSFKNDMFEFCNLQNLCMTKIYAKTLAKETIIKINEQFHDGIMRNEAELEHIVFKVGNTRGVDRKAAMLLMEIARRRPFNDGNKRTAFESMLVLLELNGKKLKVGAASRFNVVVWSVKPRTNIDEVVTWIANHTRRNLHERSED